MYIIFIMYIIFHAKLLLFFLFLIALEYNEKSRVETTFSNTTLGIKIS